MYTEVREGGHVHTEVREGGRGTCAHRGEGGREGDMCTQR